MLRVENVETVGWGPAIVGMRNPMNSWDKMDTVISATDGVNYLVELGPNDERLMRTLISQGTSDHCKFRRMLGIYCDIEGPLYWWKEMDTYAVGTVKNSCSTMHKVMSGIFYYDMFSWEDVTDPSAKKLCESTLDVLNSLRNRYFRLRKEGDRESAKEVWRNLIQVLPSAWNQRRTMLLNYEVMSNIYHARKNHKLVEWHQFIESMIEHLPYPWIFTGEE